MFETKTTQVQKKKGVNPDLKRTAHFVKRSHLQKKQILNESLQNC